MLLSAGAKTECADRSGQTALSIAAKQGFTEIAKLLLHAGADIEHKRPLLMAISSAQIQMVRLLVEQGADATARDAGDQTTLHCLNDDLVEVVELLLSNNADIEARDDQARTPLLSALARGQYGLAQCLIEKGADFNVKSSGGKSALHILAAFNTHERLMLVQCLLKAGARVDDIDDVGETPLHRAIRKSNVDVARCLWERSDKTCAGKIGGATALSMARSVVHKAGLEDGEAWSVLEILISGCDLADLQTRDGDGRDIIHDAVRRGRLGIMQKLFERGIDMTAKTTRGNSPIAIAKQTLAQLHGLEDSNFDYGSLETRVFFRNWMQGVQQVVDFLSPHVAEEEGACEEYRWTNKDLMALRRREEYLWWRRKTETPLRALELSLIVYPATM